MKVSPPLSTPFKDKTQFSDKYLNLSLSYTIKFDCFLLALFSSLVVISLV